mgnify:CR=1 FL=1
MLMASNMPYLDTTSVETNFDIEPHCIFLKNGKLTEAGLIENAAQSCGAIVAQSYAHRNESNEIIGQAIGFISAIKKIEIIALPELNERIVTKGKLLSRFDDEKFSLCTVESATFRNGELIVACTFNFLIQAMHLRAALKSIFRAMNT